MLLCLNNEAYIECKSHGYDNESRDSFQLLRCIKLIYGTTPEEDQILNREHFWNMNYNKFHSTKEWWIFIQDAKGKQVALGVPQDEKILLQDVIINLGDHPLYKTLQQEYTCSRLTMPMVVATIQREIEAEANGASCFMASRQKSKSNSTRSNQQELLLSLVLRPLAVRAYGASTQYYLHGKSCLPDKNPCSDPFMPKCAVKVSGAVPRRFPPLLPYALVAVSH